jgi:ubiquinone/menaquinone biosynthesis C-methylase UbiE
MLIEARKKLSLLPSEVLVRLERGDVFNLRFGKAEFDVVIVFRLFHLMPEAALGPAIKELCRVARKDVVVQTYVQMSRFRARMRKIASLFADWPSNSQATAPVRPWSHIQAYYYQQALFDSKFRMHDFIPSTTTLLDIYENHEVRATVYSKQG